MVYVIDANTSEMLNSFSVFEDAVSFIDENGLFEITRDGEDDDVDLIIYVDDGEEQ